MSSPSENKGFESTANPAGVTIDMVERSEQDVHSRIAGQIRTTGYMVFFSIVIAMSGFMLGFDTSYSGTVLQMSPFIKSFGTCATVNGIQTCRLSALQQSITSISTLFTGLGCALTVLTNSRLGRRVAIQAGCALVIIGAAGQLGTSGNYAAYVACKCIAAVGIGHFIVAAITYGVECTSPQKRGALLALFGIGNAAGTLVIASVCLGTSTIPTDWAWRTPIICEIPISLLYMILIQTFPESPRYLMTKGREEDARQSFAKFYESEPSSILVSAQMMDTQATIEFEQSMSSTTSPLEIFHPSYIRRTLISCLALAASALSGTWFVVPYAAIFLAGVGIKNPFLINVALASCSFGGSVCGPFVVEYIGRRTSMIVGYVIMAACMLIFSAVSTGLGSGTETAKNVLVAFLCIWDFSFASLVGASSWLTSVEVHSIRHRTYAQSFVATVGESVAFAASFWTPYMLNSAYGNMGTNVGYFYFGLTVVSLILIILFVPETARLSLEQVDDIFASKLPAWKTSLWKNKRIAAGEENYLSEQVRNDAIAHVHEKGEF